MQVERRTKIGPDGKEQRISQVLMTIINDDELGIQYMIAWLPVCETFLTDQLIARLEQDLEQDPANEKVLRSREYHEGLRRWLMGICAT